MADSEKRLPKIVSQAEWQAASDKLLGKEKELTRALDGLAAERRSLPMVRIEKDYVFDGPNGKALLGTCSRSAANSSFTFHVRAQPGAGLRRLLDVRRPDRLPRPSQCPR